MSKKKDDKRFLLTIVRYLALLVLGLGNLWFFYWLFTPLTLDMSHFFLKLIEPSTRILWGDIIYKHLTIQLVPACIAGSAYYLLTILSLSIPSPKPLKRALLLVFTLGSFLVLNVARIVLFSNLTTWDLFNVAHLIGWYLISTAFVIGIWLLAVKAFKIKDIPVYTDLKFIVSKTKKKNSEKAKNSKRSKKN